MNRSLPISRLAICILLSVLLDFEASADDSDLRTQAKTAIQQAARFFREQVASHGGYVYHYSLDLNTRWGEGLATKDQIWVQPPGTPTVGMAFLKAHQATGERHYLDAARDAAEALAYGQVQSGGWTNCIDFDPQGARVAQYRNGQGRGRNTSSLDDGQTQSAIRLLIHVDAELAFKDERIHESARIALDALLAAQFSNGAFPQVWDEQLAPDQPAMAATYPDYDWRTEGRIKNYWDMYTLNDNVCGYVADTLYDAYTIYHEDRYLTALLQLGDFLLQAQMPEPQPGWAQQYDYRMRPIWARKFEPPAVAGDETQEVLLTLLQIYRITGDGKYLEPFPTALAWLKRSLLSDGRLARYYELRTNRPLYMTRSAKTYTLTYDDSNLPTHYGWKIDARLSDINAAYRAALADETMRGTHARNTQRESHVRQVIAELDTQGRWISVYHGKRLVGQPKFAIDSPYLSSAEFSENLTTLSEYLIDTAP